MSAVQKPATVTPGTMAAASMIRNVLITRANNPRVMIESGKVRATSTGLMKVLIAPSTTARTRADTTPSTPMPGTRYAEIPMAMAEMIQCINVFISLYILTDY